MLEMEDKEMSDGIKITENIGKIATGKKIGQCIGTPIGVCMCEGSIWSDFFKTGLGKIFEEGKDEHGV